MYKLLAFALFAAVSCNDLVLGPEGGKLVFDETKEASPAIWKQKNFITVTANETELISRVVIIDRRPEKDGEANITQGGPGQKNVTIELKSPTVFRGYDFQVEVYTKDDDVSEHLPVPEHPINTGLDGIDMENDTQVNLNTKTEQNTEHEILVTENPTTDPIVKYVENKPEIIKTPVPLKPFNEMDVNKVPSVLGQDEVKIESTTGVTEGIPTHITTESAMNHEHKHMNIPRDFE